MEIYVRVNVNEKQYLKWAAEHAASSETIAEHVKKMAISAVIETQKVEIFREAVDTDKTWSVDARVVTKSFDPTETTETSV